jgi:hypothetical protein
MKYYELWYLLELHIKCQTQGSEITKKLFLMGATRERDLHKSLKLLLKECEKGLWLFIDLRLKSSNLKECPGITLSGRSQRGQYRYFTGGLCAKEKP